MTEGFSFNRSPNVAFPCVKLYNTSFGFAISFLTILQRITILEHGLIFGVFCDNCWYNVVVKVAGYEPALNPITSLKIFDELIIACIVLYVVGNAQLVDPFVNPTGTDARGTLASVEIKFSWN